MTVFVSPAGGRVTSRYGPREKHPVTKKAGFHRGDDIAPPVAGTRGVPLFAALDGVVVAASGSVKRRADGTWPPNPVTGTWNTGNFIIIRTDLGYYLYYGHPDQVHVKKGQRVKAGDRIGIMGNSGNVTGIHLHFEVWADGNHNNHFSPVKLFKRFGVALGSEPVIPKTPTTPLPGKDEFDMASISDLRNIIREELRVSVNSQNDSLHRATRNDTNAAKDEVITAVGSATQASTADLKRDNTRNAENVHKSIRRDIPTDVLGYKGNNADRDVYAYIRGTHALVSALTENYEAAGRAVASGEEFDMEKLSRGVAASLANANLTISFPIPEDHGEEVK